MIRSKELLDIATALKQDAHLHLNLVKKGEEMQMDLQMEGSGVSLVHMLQSAMNEDENFRQVVIHAADFWRFKNGIKSSNVNQ